MSPLHHRKNGEPTPDPAFWRGKRVLVTGHTGFKGSWLTFWLSELGATVRGFAKPADSTPALFHCIGLEQLCQHDVGDIRDARSLSAAVVGFKPDIVLHLAAQSLVLRSYRDPLETFETNVQGTVSLLDSCRRAGPRAVLVITSDKCYLNRDWMWPYREEEPLGGDDPYSASKACAELVVQSWRRSFFNERQDTVLASARAGNIFGGGDWSENRIIPDAVRAFTSMQRLTIRRPDAVRPWQHVVAPLAGYLVLVERMWRGGHAFGTAFNFGPQADAVVTVRDLVDGFRHAWGGDTDVTEAPVADAPHEAAYLTLDSTRAYRVLGWRPHSDIRADLAATAEWYKAQHGGAGVDELRDLCRRILRDSCGPAPRAAAASFG